MNRIEFVNTEVSYGAVTLKDITKPESHNMALHVCIDPEEVIKNRKELAKALQIPLENWALPWQKHTNAMERVTYLDKSKGAFSKDTSIMDVDAVYTTEPDILIGVFTADCVGMLIVDESTPFIGAIHSGWKGTTLQICSKCIRQWIQEDLIHPETVQVFFSPSILFDSLEVGMEVVEAMKQLDFDVEPFIKYMPNNKAYIDNQGLNVQMLLNEGIPMSNIHPSQLDTKKELETCFSFRNDKKTGEHFTFGYLKKPKE